MVAKKTGIMLVVLSVLSVPALRGDDDMAEAQYGRGVQAFFAGDPAVAVQALNASIQERAHDPRPHFFRGLAQQMLGNPEAALKDFAAGAAHEASGAGQSFDVDSALERIQGTARLEIEKQRKKARADARSQRRPDEYSVTPGGSQLFDPANLPDLSALADPTIPFPDTSVTVYFPPSKAARSQPDPVPAVVSPTQSGASDPNDPFAGGNVPMNNPPPAAGDNPFDDDGAAPEPAQDPDADDPFGGG